MLYHIADLVINLHTQISHREIYLIDLTTKNTWISQRVIYLIDWTTENTYISHRVIYLIDLTTENTYISNRVIYFIDLTTENIQISQRAYNERLVNGENVNQRRLDGEPQQTPRPNHILLIFSSKPRPKAHPCKSFQVL